MINFSKSKLQNTMKEPSKIKDAVVAWKVDFPQLDQEKIKKYPWDKQTSTSKGELRTNLHDVVKQLFELAVDEEFEDGFESLFSRSLVSFIEEYGKKALDVLTPIFINEQINPEIIAEALRWIGRIEHQPTHSDRLQLLEQCLFCSSPYVRDGAALGIASMNDLRAIPSLRSAIQKEFISELREDMKQVLHQLESDKDGADS